MQKEIIKGEEGKAHFCEFKPFSCQKKDILIHSYSLITSFAASVFWKICSNFVVTLFFEKKICTKQCLMTMSSSAGAHNRDLLATLPRKL